MSSSFIKFNQPKGSMDITTMAMGEEGGKAPKKTAPPENDKKTTPKPQPQPKPDLTTMAMGEEGGSGPFTLSTKETGEVPDMTTMAMGEEGGGFTSMSEGEEGGKGPEVSTMAIGEEGGGFTSMSEGEEGGKSPEITTMAIGEEGGSYYPPVGNPTPKPVSSPAQQPQNFNSFLDLLKRFQTQFNWF